MEDNYVQQRQKLLSEMTFSDAVNLARNRIERVSNIEGKVWGPEGCFIELSKQVGDLAKLIMTKEGYYHESSGKRSPHENKTVDDIADELADILYVLIRIADHYNINLLDAHIAAREKEDVFLVKAGL